MKKPFFIIHDKIIDPVQASEFTEVLTSNFISKKAKEDAYVIIVEDMDSKEVYELLASKLSFDSRLMVIEMTNFYGFFITGAVFEWLKESFPTWNWIKK
uniref:hypothetical protein n=1 Tax=Flavobacterium sp. TaxID=239 RepID=UPI00404B57CA